jgi:hypothetical protein
MNKITLPAQVINTSQVLTQIYSTTNYSMFGHIGGNRNLNTTNLTKIKQSLSKKHIKTNAVICILDPEDLVTPLKIVDGQHRFEACKTLNIPVSYVIDDNLSMESILNDITLLNTASKEWDVNDFMGSEATKGNQNYILYSSVYTSYNNSFDHESLFFILNNNEDRKGPNISFPPFKAGELKFDLSDYNYLTNRLKDLSLFNQYSEMGGKRYYQKALNKLMNTKGFDVNQMLSKILIRQSTITKCTTIDGALRKLVKIYEYKSKSKFGFNTDTDGNIISITIK